jgi:hypothetical protein
LHKEDELAGFIGLSLVLAALLVGAIAVVARVERYLGGPFVAVHLLINALLVGFCVYAMFFAPVHAHSPSALFLIPCAVLAGFTYYGFIVRRGEPPLEPSFNRLSRAFAALYGVAIIVIAIAILHDARRSADRLKNQDQTALESLRRTGVDMSQPHEIVLHFHLPSESAAAPLREYLSSKGFTVRIDRFRGPHWGALSATKLMVLTETELVLLRAELTKLAAAANGRYDGWGMRTAPRPKD